MSNVVIEGVGKDAEIVTNENGGKQSKTPMALHLVDPNFLKAWAQGQIDRLCRIAEDMEVIPRDLIGKSECYSAILLIATFMIEGDCARLKHAMVRIENDSVKMLTRIAKVLQEGAEKYEPNNWRLIPQESHINHALIHLVAHLMGDTQDDHLDHALCRLMMAICTDKSSGFDYNKYVSQTGRIVEVPSASPDYQPIMQCTGTFCDNIK